MKLLLAALFLLIFAGPSHAEFKYFPMDVSQMNTNAASIGGSGHDFKNAPVNSRQPIVIYSDFGGSVSDFEEKVQYYASISRPIKVVGSCRSACTLVLSYNNVCVYRSAVFKWHTAYNPYDRNDLDYETTARMIHWMPWSIQSRLKRSVAQEYNAGSTMTGSELIAMGAARECK